MKQRITWKRFTEWMAFDGVHGLDDFRHELQFARFASSYFNCKGGHTRPLDFMLFREDVELEDNTAGAEAAVKAVLSK